MNEGRRGSIEVSGATHAILVFPAHAILSFGSGAVVSHSLGQCAIAEVPYRFVVVHISGLLICLPYHVKKVILVHGLQPRLVRVGERHVNRVDVVAEHLAMNLLCLALPLNILT